MTEELHFTTIDEVYVWQSHKPVYSIVTTTLPSGATYSGAFSVEGLNRAYVQGDITLSDLEASLHHVIAKTTPPLDDA